MALKPHRNLTRARKKTVLTRVREMMQKTAHKGEYIESIGRRKTATARVRLFPASENSMTVNGIDATDYFKTDRLTGLSLIHI